MLKRNQSLKTLFTAVLITGFMVGLVACGEPTALDKLQEKNKDWLKSVDKVTLGYNLSLQDKMKWGMPCEKVRKIVGEPFENDYETYVSKLIPVALPLDDSWKGDSKSINPEAFVKTEMMSYYTFTEGDELYEYGYQCYKPTLEQYDFLKEYYSKKYGKPKEEEYIWNDESYKPNGKEDLHAMFKEGKVKVLTAWDIDELESVLVVDWLNDPVKTENNFGQITFYQKTGELNLNEE